MSPRPDTVGTSLVCLVSKMTPNAGLLPAMMSSPSACLSRVGSCHRQGKLNLTCLFVY